jgi:hypothetical protein
VDERQRRIEMTAIYVPVFDHEGEPVRAWDVASLNEATAIANGFFYRENLHCHFGVDPGVFRIERVSEEAIPERERWRFPRLFATQNETETLTTAVDVLVSLVKGFGEPHSVTIKRGTKFHAKGVHKRIYAGDDYRDIEITTGRYRLYARYTKGKVNEREDSNRPGTDERGLGTGETVAD